MSNNFSSSPNVAGEIGLDLHLEMKTFQLCLPVRLDMKTAFITDERMLLHENTWFPNHVENPQRVSTTLERCMNLGLLSRCLLLTAEPASDELLSYCHSSNYISQIAETETMNEEQIKALMSTLDAVYFNTHTNLAARLSIGSTVQAVESVHRGDVRNAFCLIRPPGHHAMESEASGFCIFNNIAVAANYALDKLEYHRILIIDWDIHHGNATQYAFYENPRVLYISIHRYDDQKFWPNLRESNYDFTGSGRGRGYNINVALNGKNIGDADYLAIFHRLILPVAFEYDPDLVLISAGYDSGYGCPVGQIDVSPALFAHLTHKMMALAEGKVVVALEGGYNADTVAESVAHTVSALLGDPMPSLEPLEPISPSVLKTISDCISVLRQRWKSLHLFPVSNILTAPDLSHLKQNSWLDVKIPSFEPEDHLHEPEQQRIVDEHLAYLKTTHPVACSRKIVGTCIVYDSRMENHKNDDDRNHPENPHRIRRAYDLLDEYGLARRCKRIEARHATREELLRVHNESYINQIAGTASMDQAALTQMADNEDSIYLNRHTYDCALLATGSVLALIDEVCSGGSLNGMAIVRPPGHHALEDRCMGFCFFNHVAVGARHAQQVHDLERIAIVDWDVHHGNGTQHIFREDPNILYISVHRYDDGRFFPNATDGAAEYTGENDGLGKTVHVAWNGRHVRDGEYIAVFTHIILPIIYEFRPQLILVSAGFDAVRGDRLGGLGVSPECFGHLTHLLMAAANLIPSVEFSNRHQSQNGPSTSVRQTRLREQKEKSEAFSGGLILVLEGGYNLTSNAEAMCHSVASLLGDCCPRISYGIAASERNGKTIWRTIEAQGKFWKQLEGYEPVQCFYDQETIRRLMNSKTRRSKAQTSNAAILSELIETEGNSRLDDTSLSDHNSPRRLSPSEAEACSGLMVPDLNNMVTSSTLVATASSVTFVSVPQNNTGASVSDVPSTHRSTTIGQLGSNSLAPSSSSMPRENGAISALVDGISHLGINSPHTVPSDHSSVMSDTPNTVPIRPVTADATGASSSTRIPSQDESRDHETSAMVASATLQDLMHYADIGSEDIHAFFGLSSSQQLPPRLFAVTPLSWCPHLGAVRQNPEWEPNVNSLCTRCDNQGENWVCLSCYAIYCGRYANSHMIEHYSSARHPIVLSFADLSSWCYECESYVHNEALLEAKRAAHRAKFGVDMPGS